MSQVILRPDMSLAEYEALSPADRERAKSMFAKEFYDREPTEDDLQTVRELYADGHKPGDIAKILDLKSARGRAAVRKFIKTLEKPKPLTADELFDIKMLGRIRIVGGQI